MSTPKTLTDEQCQALIEQLQKDYSTESQYVKATRNSCIAVVLLEAGIRVGELCGLRINDLWFSDQPVRCLVVRKEIAKNNKERLIPISLRLNVAIKTMNELLWSPVSASPCSFAFFARPDCGPLTTRSVERFISSAGNKAFNQNVTPHMLRHTFATRLMRKTNARNVQELLGHESLQSTQIYMHPNMDDLIEAINS